MSRPFVYFFSVPKRKMDNSDENYVFALHFVTLTDVYLKKNVSDNSLPDLFKGR